jgi:hypothetical protein|tara:strand:+ start:11530 stop:12111 length:582 start_codon:yes stop_codon:yes gene_type:complete
MTTSTAPAATYTAAPAALLRGGDRNAKQHLSAAPTGRPVQSSGSGIKSHCPAGAGIIKPVSSTRETANTPTQGVRHAAEPSTPLRSGGGAAAQLVEGYKRNLSHITMPKACVSCLHYQAKGFANDAHCPFATWNGCKQRTPYGTCSRHKQEVFATEICTSYSCDPQVHPIEVENRPHPRTPMQEQLGLEGSMV